MTSKEAIAAFAAVLENVSTGGSARPMEHIGYPALYADIVAAWTRSKRFLDEQGWPRPLAIEGRSGFAALVRSANHRANPEEVLKVLMRYGNVKRSRKGTYKLTRSFFYTSADKRMAYEPVAYFLSDASATLTGILRRSTKWRGPDLFWQKAERYCISDATAKRFVNYAKERCLIFLDEMDDWLQAHSRSTGNGTRQGRRVGLGIFSIYSDRE